MSRSPLATLAVALLCAIAPSFAVAQADYPSKTVTMIVPFPPGGVADITARPLAEAMGRQLKQTVLVENKAGAGGGVGMQFVARAQPDGYTVLLALSSISIIPEADKVLGRDPMFQLNQLVPIARFTADPTVLAVRADSPWKSVGDLLEDARKAPGTIPYGSSGNYGTMHVPMEMLTSASGTKMLHVPYTGAGPAVVGLLGGPVEAPSTGPSTVMGHVKGGKGRVVATWEDWRHPALADVPARNAELHALFERLFKQNLEEHPEFATFLGVEGYEDRLAERSPAAIARRKARLKETIAELKRFDPAQLSTQDRISRDVMLENLALKDQMNALYGDLPFSEEDGWMPISPMHGPQELLAGLARATPIRRERDYENYVKRLAAIPRSLEEQTAIMRTGIKTGWMPPRAAMERVPGMLAVYAGDDVTATPLWRPFTNFPADMSDTQRKS